MKITILAVNKMRSGPELEITNRYIERFNGLGNNLNLGPVNIVEIEPNDKKPKHLNCLNDKVCLLDDEELHFPVVHLPISWQAGVTVASKK